MYPVDHDSSPIAHPDKSSVLIEDKVTATPTVDDTPVPASRRVRVLVVDDEEAARRRLRRLLAADPRVSIVGEAVDGPSALARLQLGDVDAVFLDIQMPGMSGLDVARQLRPESRVRCVFVTAHDAHAINAFELFALDYLLKPVTPVRLADAVGRLHQTIDVPASRRVPDASDVATTAPLSRLLVPDGKGQRMVDLTQVHLISAYGNYVKLHVAAQALLYRQTMLRMEQVLDTREFVRIHRGAIVNVRFVTSVSPYLAGDYTVSLKVGPRVRLSRHYRDAFFERFSPAL
jgi:two-component system, LytTR family, response regulator